MLITSSQASVALTAVIIFACTMALFLSGYAIQQRTLRDLRAAIKPPPRPSPQVYIQESAGWQAAAARGDYDKERPEGGDDSFTSSRDDTVVEVKSKGKGKDGLSLPAFFGGGKDTPTAQRPLSRVERRRKIKEEIKKLSQGESPVYYQRRLW